MAGEPPKLHIAAEQNEASLKQQEEARRHAIAASDVRWALIELAANIMRISRGAGRSPDIGPQCVGVIESFEAYRQVVGMWPSSYEISTALAWMPDHEERVQLNWSEREYSVADIVGGSLQIAASSLLRQRTQEAAGENQMYRGLNGVYDLRRQAAEERAAAEVAERRAKRATSPRSKTKPKRKPKKAIAL